jgi:hypothetical protein
MYLGCKKKQTHVEFLCRNLVRSCHLGNKNEAWIVVLKFSSKKIYIFIFLTRVFESRQGLGTFLFTTVSRPTLGPTQTPIQRVPGALSLGVKRTAREADHSPPSSAEVKNA